MKRLILGAAVVAMTATAVHAQNGPGGGGKPDRAQSVSDQGAGKPGKPGKPGGDKARPADRGNGNGAGNSDAKGQGNGAAKKADSGNAQNKGQAVAESRPAKGPPPAMRGNDNSNAKDNASRADNDRPGVRVLEDGRRYYAERGTRLVFDFDHSRRGLVNGCPPGLAKKNNGCTPPGLAKKDVRHRYADYQPDWWGLTGLPRGDGRYYYDNGYLLRLNGDRVAGFIPLFGGALSVGRTWPSYYQPIPVPQYYANYYDLGPANSYRYADNVLYRVDPTTATITSIAALLTGNDIRIGAPMPTGYDVYNVPYPYRSQYSDGPSANYRYNDGYVYQVDPTTRLVTAAIEMIAS